MKKTLCVLALTLAVSTSALAAEKLPDGKKYLETCAYLQNVQDFGSVKFIYATYDDGQWDKPMETKTVAANTCLNAELDTVVKVYAVDSADYEVKSKKSDYNPAADMDAYPVYVAPSQTGGAIVQRLGTSQIDTTDEVVDVAETDTYMNRYYKIEGVDNGLRVMAVTHLEDTTNSGTTEDDTTWAGSNLTLESKIKVDSKIFGDVSTSSIYAEAALRLKRLGIVEGYEDNTFKPNNPISRSEFTKIVLGEMSGLVRNGLCTESYAREDGTYDDMFTDVKLNMAAGETAPWYLDTVCVAKAEKVVSGYPDGSFKPNQNINYAEAAKVIVNSQNVAPAGTTNPWYEQFTGVFDKINGKPATILGSAQTLTRGEMVLMMNSMFEHKDEL